jgi:hypothetical protein
MVRTEDVERTWTDIVVSARSRLRGIASKIAPRIGGLDERAAHDLIGKEIDEALVDLSKSIGTAVEPEPRRRSRRRKMGPPAEDDGFGMGGSEPGSDAAVAGTGALED